MANFRDVLLISEKTLKEYSLIDENVSFDYLKPIVKMVQDTRLTRLLGQKMYDDIRSEVINESVSDAYALLLDYYITDILIWGVMAEIQIPISFKIRNKGLSILTNEDGTVASASEIQYTKGQFENAASYYEGAMVEYLGVNASEYPLWYRPSCPGSQCNIAL